MAGTLARTPAFNPALRTETVEGRTVLRYTDKMYSSAEYYAWIALDWQARARSLLSANKDGDEAQAQAAAAGFRHALEAATESLRRNPSDATAWMIVAKAQARLGEMERAVEAYLRSRDLSPNSSAWALDRLSFLIRIMSEPEGRRLALAKVPPGAVIDDLQTVGKAPYYSAVAQRLSRNPSLATFGVEPYDP